MSSKILTVKGGVCAPKGFVAGGIHCGIRKSRTKRDLALIYSSVLCTAAAVYTQNKVYGAPITVTRKNLADGMAKAVICNSGNANTCNKDGVYKAELMCELAAKALNIKPTDIIIASTGVIGQTLDIEPIESGIPKLIELLSTNGSDDAAEAIMTTDTKKKVLAVEFDIMGTPCRIGAMTKGSGMINPNMATMLSFITSDAAITQPMLQHALNAVVADTYNMVSVDGDTSTNDMVSIMANGLAGNKLIDAPGAALDAFIEALRYIGTYMARSIAGDGEGCTKLIQCHVSGAPHTEAAKTIAKSVINSSLFKAAMFGRDANWGRILCAIGYADANFEVDKVDVSLSSAAGCIEVCKSGFGVEFSEEHAKQVLSEFEIQIEINLNQGTEQATAWGCDLTYDYVKINGDYRT